MILDVGDIESTLKGYERLARLAAKIAKCTFEEIRLDFSGCKWFDANMSAPLGAVLAHATRATFV